jgi:hypothetical protein
LLNNYEGTTAGTINYTSTFVSFGLNPNLNTCEDTDSDGVSDILDLDDDNDGVLDETEYNCSNALLSKTGITVSSTVSWGYNSTTLANMVDGVEAIVAYSSTEFLNQTILQFDLPSAKILGQIEIGNQASYNPLGTTGTYKIQAWDGSMWTDLTGNLTLANSVPVNAANNSYKFNLPSNFTSYTKYRIFGTSNKGTVTGWMQEAYFVEKICNRDIDGDGIQNHLDLDSDDDGCSDAIEAGSSTTATSTTVYPTGTDTNTNGLLNNYEATTVGTVNYSSTYVNYALVSSINGCTDTDSDGVTDVKDLDDDNDGVLDAVECPLTQLNTNESNGTFGTAAAPRNLANTAVTGGYVYSGSNTGASQYSIVNQSTPYHPAATFWRYVGHTTGSATDAYLAVNGNTTIGNFYSESVTLQAGAKYRISFWHQAASIANDYQLAAEVLSATNAVLASANTGAQNSLGWKLATIDFTSTSNQAVTFIIKNISTNTSGNDFSIDDISIQAIGCPDSDLDGIPNQLDLDSDGDGCSDAIEGGSSSTATSTSVYSTGTDTNTNGLLNNYEGTTAGTVNYASTYTNFALSNTINACTDTDSDGIKDIIDIDDDNDGVLDVVEQSCTSAVMSKSGTTISSTVNWVFQNATGLNALLDGTLIQQVYPSDVNLNNKTIFQFNLPTQKILNLIELANNANQTPFLAGGTYKIQGSNDGGTSWIDIVSSQAVVNSSPILAATNSIKFDMPQNVSAFSSYRVYGITISGQANWSQELYFREVVCTTIDTDNDGIPNQLDLDSDGDNCADAIESCLLYTSPSPRD